MKILVVGGTGNVGAEVVKELQKRNADIRLLVRKEGTPTPKGVEVAIGDLLDPVSVQKALDGVDKLYLLNAVTPDELTQGLIAYDLAKRLKLKHIVYHSVFRVDHFKDVPHFASKLAVESAMRENFRRIPSITARIVPIAISVPRRRRSSQLRRRNRRLASTRTGLIDNSPRGSSGPQGLKPASLLALGGTAEAVPIPKPFMRAVLVLNGRILFRRTKRSSAGNLKSAAKNFGDAHRVPFVVACCRCLVLLAAFLLCFLFGCHGSILPFHSSWNFATVFCCN